MPELKLVKNCDDCPFSDDYLFECKIAKPTLPITMACPPPDRCPLRSGNIHVSLSPEVKPP